MSSFANAKPLNQDPLHPKRHGFPVLDGLRGLAALMVAAYHCCHIFQLDVAPFPSAFLAVDFFFLLSGFVVAHAYERRLSDGETVGKFMLRRIVRFYPLYWLGLTLPLFLIAVQMAAHLPYQNRLSTLGAYATGLFFLPSPTFSFVAHEGDSVFFVNGPSWSLSLEVAINLIYAVVCPKLSTRKLVAVVSALAIIIVITTLRAGDFDIGSLWPHYWGGWARVLFSFPCGVLLYRGYKLRSWTALPKSIGILGAFVLMAIFAFIGRNIYLEIISVLLIFPMVVFFCARAKVGYLDNKSFIWLGSISYAIYITHISVLNISHIVAQALGFEPSEHGLTFLLACLIAASLFATIIDLFYDIPVRRYLTRKLKV